jgi:riboflavin kinase/FMN adenylyltransferase
VKILRRLDQLPDHFRRGALAVGNFDGVHLGHARVLERLVANARRVGGAAVVFTFDPHPVQVLRPQLAPPPLTQTDRKAQLLAPWGVDAVIAYPTDAAFLMQTARQFFDQIVRARLEARALVEGAGFLFGRGRQGNIQLLRRFCAETAVELEVVEPVVVEGQPVSSSRIRALLAQGDVDLARRMLTEPYRVRGTVVHGAGRGASLGFPTANLTGVETLVPAEGIYAGRAAADGAIWPAAISVGPNPTFGEGGLKIEAHLIDYRGALYGRPLEVEFLSRLRGVEKFPSVDQLIAQMQRDVGHVRDVVKACSRETLQLR